MDVIGDLEMRVVQVQARGAFIGSGILVDPEIVMTMEDVTAGESNPIPVLCVIEDLQKSDSMAFEMRQNIPEYFVAGMGFSTWAPVFKIPIDLLGFPHSGKSSILIRLILRSQTTKQVYNHASCRWAHVNTGLAYLEAEKKDAEIQALTLQLGMVVAAVDGSVDPSEVACIKSWGTKAANSVPEERRSARKLLLNDAISSARAKINSGGASSLEASVLGMLRREADSRQKYETYELAVHVASADGLAHPEEMANLGRIAEGLGLNPDKVKMIMDAGMHGVALPELRNDNEKDKFLGITEQMTREEIRKHLNRLHRKYLGRQANDDKEVRSEAQHWLDLIGEARVRHLSTGGVR